MRRILLSCFVFALFVGIVSAGDEIRVSHRLVFSSKPDETDRWQLLIMVRSDTEMKALSPLLTLPAGMKLETIKPEKTDLLPNRFELFYVSLSGKTVQGERKIDISLPGKPNSNITVELVPGIDLTTLPWKSFYAGKDFWRKDVDIKKLPGTGAPWQETRLPRMWEDLGIIWARTEVFVPESLQESLEAEPLYLTVSAIDDNDIVYFNGKEIGRTTGWDTLREYPIPKEIIRFGEVNELLIAVENVNAGGGVQTDPIRIGPKSAQKATRLFPKQELQKESDRRTPREQGKPTPLRPMTVRDGVLEYEDGGEVALWGVNYYPQSWNEYKFLKEGGHDIKKVIDADMDDLVRDADPRGVNRINAIRIHVFDTEISDAEGNLVRNEHLDLLDYLVLKCNEKSVHLWLTPIAWWGSPQSRKDAFSQNIPMQAMTLCPDTWPIQQRFIKQFLEHENPYTKRRLVDEPCLNLFEIINEPLYWTHSQIRGEDVPQYGRVAVKKDGDKIVDDPNIRLRNIVQKQWRENLPGPEWTTPDAWDYYRYRTVRQYIDTMAETIRSTGAKQPVAYCAAWFNTTAPIFAAVGDSRCEAVTTVMCPGGLRQKPQADARNLLPQTGDAGLPDCLSEKARLVYEFDASDTLRQIDLYPAMARHFRNIGSQVACQFQYDSRFNAAHNRAWPTHYLNAVHTPERFVSFLIAGQTFRDLPRGFQYKPEDLDKWVFQNTAVSWSGNDAYYSTEKTCMQARATDWKPLEWSRTPERIIAVGPTPYYDYNGTGIVDLKINGGTAELRLYPDNIRFKSDVLSATPEDPLTRLEYKKHPFKLKLPGWNHTMVEGIDDGKELESGKTYRLKKKLP